MSHFEGKRTGFYPVSAVDYLEPLQLLRNEVDHLIFCDLRLGFKNRLEHVKLTKNITSSDLPSASFIIGDALVVMEYLKPTDVFFLRGDSSGEGGSGLDLLGKGRIQSVLTAVKHGGIIVTDKPNAFNWLNEMLSGKSSQYQVGDRTLYLTSDQPWIDIGLYKVRAD